MLFWQLRSDNTYPSRDAKEAVGCYGSEVQGTSPSWRKF